jgi:hypothetical protein
MLASYGSSYQTVYAYTSNSSYYYGNWTPLTGGTHSTTLVSNGGNLYLLGSNGPDYQSQTVWQYNGSPYNWSILTGSDTNVLQLVKGSDSNLYMVAYKNYLTEVYQYRGSGTPLTGASLQNALGTWQLGLAHPVASAPYSPVNGTLFNPNNGLASYLDVQQGVVGDCWLMASLEEVAAREPYVIPSMVFQDGTTTENGSTVGVYSVRLFDPYGNSQYFTVDSELPGGGNTYDHPVGGAGAVNGSPNLVLWAALAEKAYAQASSSGFVPTSYNSSGYLYVNAYAGLNGGWPEWALGAITGKSTTPHYAINPSDVASAWNAGELVVLCTTSPSSSWIVANHCYALVGYTPSSGSFTLVNAWGTDSNGYAPGNGSKWGQFWANAGFLSNNFSSQAFGLRSASGGREDGHDRSSQELADLAFMADLLDPHAKAPALAGLSPTSSASVH